MPVTHFVLNLNYRGGTILYLSHFQLNNVNDSSQPYNMEHVTTPQIYNKIEPILSQVSNYRAV